jgi:hypothetical protein
LHCWLAAKQLHQLSGSLSHRLPAPEYEHGGSMNKNSLYILLGALLVTIVGFSIYTYREESKPKGVELKIDEQGVSIEQN